MYVSDVVDCAHQSLAPSARLSWPGSSSRAKLPSANAEHHKVASIKLMCRSHASARRNPTHDYPQNKMSSSRVSADGHAATHSFQLLTATYDSPTNAAFSYRHQLPTPVTSETADRVAYLGALRKATAELQERINAELTQRMEEDKARDATGTAEKGMKNTVADEGKEEENYGEEVVGDD